MKTPFRRRSTAAVAAVLAAVVSAHGSAATRSPAPTGAPPPHAAAPAPAVPSPGTRGASAAVPASDRDFVTMAASSGMLEVDASRLALERSKDSQVRTFAQRMVDDHGKANAELKAAAKKAGLADVPATMTSTHNGHLERLRALSGQSFDREYAAQIGIAAHTESVALFDKASKDVANPELRSFAGATLPKLRAHLGMSKRLAQSVGAGEDRMKGASTPPDPATRSTMGTTGTTGSDTAAGGTSGRAGANSTPGASGTTGSSGATGSGTGGSASGTAGGSTAGSTTGSSRTGTGGGTGTNPTNSSTGR